MGLETAIITVTQGDWQYLREWIEYHHNIGVSMFFIGYNGPKEKFADLPQYDYVRYYDYAIDSNDYRRNYMNRGGNVRFSNWHDWNLPEYHMAIMQQIENQLFREVLYFFRFIKYVCVIDTDEFLDIYVDEKDITRFLLFNFNDTHAAESIQMHFYTDNNLIYNDPTKGVIERFTEKFKTTSVTECSGYSKVIVNMHHKDVQDGIVRMVSPHTCTRLKGNALLDASRIELRHYFTKSLEEWIAKMNPSIDLDYFKRFDNHIFKEYFTFNTITDKKLLAIPELLKKYNIEYDPMTDEDESFKIAYKMIHKL